MVYNNFILRLLFSIIFISIYLIFSYINFQYVFYLIFLIYLLIFFEIFFYFKKFKLFPIIYILISFIFFLNIDFSNNIFLHFNLFILVVVSLDIFSYIFGKKFGKTKLIRISPNKTYEGLLGGALTSFILGLLFSYYLDININTELIIFILFVILNSFIGDIIESFFKRKNNLKNSSEFIPGHGGVFDRFDSFIFSIMYYSITINL